VDRWEARLREALLSRRDGSLPGGHALARPVELLRARRGDAFGEYDGNLAALGGHGAIQPGATTSPTALESYAACGFRYFLASVLRLRGVEEPADAVTMAPAERGTLVHRVLERFFSEQRGRGRPSAGERWGYADVEQLLQILEDEYARLRTLGRAGLDVFAGLQRGQLRADLAAFLELDSEFRARTGAIPSEFELRLTPTSLNGVGLTGFVDRLDRTPDGKRAWVIDYKTGAAYDKPDETDPFAGGTRLQLPVYVLAAAGAEQVQALYWFVSRRGEFQQMTYEETPENRARFEATLAAILSAQRAGSFPAVPGDEDEFYGGFANCRYCDYDRLCSRRRNYELVAKWDHPGIAPWRAVAETARGERRP
jgi:RecB family exonuclease